VKKVKVRWESVIRSDDWSVCFTSCLTDRREAEEFERLWVHGKVNVDTHCDL